MPNFASKDTIFDLNIDSLLNPSLIALTEEANHHSGQLNQLSLKLSEYQFVTDVLRNIEALTSAKIEGTTGNLEDLYNQEDLSFDKKVQLKLFSAINYKNTIRELESIVQTQKHINLGLVRHLHKLLTTDDPATKGTPGQFRLKNVKIRNSKLGDSYPAESISIPGLMQDYEEEKFAFPKKSLLNIAIKHYQFESIHPFEDGNGRTGRLLIITQMLQEGLLENPILNLSSYLDNNRDEYISVLRRVSEEGHYHSWVDFFLKGIVVQSGEVKTLIEALKKLKDSELETLRTRINATHVPFTILDLALESFYFTLQDVEKYLEQKKLPLKDFYQTARNNVHRLEKLSLIKKSHKRSQADVYVHVGLQKVLMDDFSPIK